MARNQVKLRLVPNLKSRESVQIAAGRVQFSVTSLATGRTVYVRLDSKRKLENDDPRRFNGAQNGWAKTYVNTPLDESTHVFVSEKGYGTPKLGTFYPRSGVLWTDLEDRNPHLWALRQIAAHVSGEPTNPGVTIQSESVCGMCARELTDPVSVQRGIGPECAGSPTGTRILHAMSVDTPLFTGVKPMAVAVKAS